MELNPAALSIHTDIKEKTSTKTMKNYLKSISLVLLLIFATTSAYAYVVPSDGDSKPTYQVPAISAQAILEAEQPQGVDPDLVDGLKAEKDYLRDGAIWIREGATQSMQSVADTNIIVHYLGIETSETRETNKWGYYRIKEDRCAKFEVHRTAGDYLYGDKRDVIPVAGTDAFCLTENDVGFPLEVFAIGSDRVLVAYNPQRHKWDKVLKVDEVGVERDTYKIDHVIEEDLRSLPKNIDQPVDLQIERDVVEECQVNGKTVPLGTRLIVDGAKGEVAVYCDKSGNLLSQKADGVEVTAAHECLHGQMQDGKCVDTTPLLQKVWKWIFN